MPKVTDTTLAALLAFDREMQGGHGGAHNPLGIGGRAGKTAPDIVNVDNINVDNPERPTGTSAQAGIRRLRKAAEAGDEAASRRSIWEFPRLKVSHRLRTRECGFGECFN